MDVHIIHGEAFSRCNMEIARNFVDLKVPVQITAFVTFTQEFLGVTSILTLP